MPTRALLERHVEHQLGERIDQLGVLGERQELEWRQVAQTRMVPAHERLERDDLSGRALDLRLVVQLEFVRVDRDAQILDQTHPVTSPVQLLAVDRKGLACDLRAVHRQVGAAQQVGSVGRVDRRDGDADAGADLGADRPDLERLEQARGDPLSHDRAALAVGVQQRDHELVASQAGDEVAVAQDSRQALAELAQELVADRVAEGVVDLLESVEVDEQACQRSARAGVLVLLLECIEQLEEGTPVGERRQLIGDRLAVLVARETLETLDGEPRARLPLPASPTRGSGRRG